LVQRGAFRTPIESFAGYTSPKPVRWSPLHTACVAATLSTLLALLLAEPALAHVNVQPRLVQQGTATTLRVELPQLQAGAPPVRLEVDGEGVTVLSSTLEGIGGFSGAETLWNVRLRVSRSVLPGDLLLVLRALFADGKSVEVDGTIVVVPPAAEAGSGSFPWLGVVAGVSIALALAGSVLVLARRRGGW
jgi:hypothetical protein